MPYEYPDNIHLSVTLEMNLNRMEYSRSRYTAFDLLSDVGGLKGMFAELFVLFLAAWNFNAVDNYMVSRLFKMKAKDSDQIHGIKGKSGRNVSMKMSRFPYCKDYVMSWIGCISCCNRKNRNERAFEKAREQLEKEMDIIEFIKQRRYLSKALSKLLPKKDRLALEE